jgi:shikimate kinase
MAFPARSRHDLCNSSRNLRGTPPPRRKIASMTTPASASLPRLLRPVVLVGMMGSGKTAVGRALSARLSVPFRDSDAAIEEAAQASIAEIFARWGEPFFRDREAEVIARLLGQGPAVVSTGGGAFMSERNRRAISDMGVSIWLDAALDTLWDRVRHKDTRPLLRTANPRQTLSDLYDIRVPVYRLADLAVPVAAGYSIEETTSRVLAALAHRPDVLEPA